MGLKDLKETTPKEIDSFGEIFFRNLRKKISPTSPFVATYFVNGNHDGKLGNNKTFRNKAIRKTIKYLRQPAWGQDSHEQNYFPLFFGLRNVVLPISGDTPEEDVLVMILDGESYLNHKPQKPEDYTLGNKQKYDRKNLLEQTEGVRYKLYLIHRLVGGMFGGPFGNLENHSYARGLLATKDDYEELKKLGIKLGLTLNPNKVEQVQLTNLFMEHNHSGRDRIIIGHDHVHSLRHVEDENGQLELMCAGALKHKGEINFYDGPYSTLWKHFYGDFGVYHQDNRASKSGEADFWSPSGYVRLTISRDVITSEYIRAADNYPLTNIPIDYEVGDVLPNIMHTEFPSKSDYGFIY